MYVAHYKSVVSSSEFYSRKRNTLDFPTQVEFDGERYMLFRTVQVSTPTQEKRFLDMTSGYGIPSDIRID